MPYHIGEKGSNGCSGYPVVDDKGKTVGCHPTRAKAVDHLQALYVNVPDASKADTPMDVAYNPIITDPTPASPSPHINPSAGMKKPQYLKHDSKNPNCQCDKCMKLKYLDKGDGMNESASTSESNTTESFFNFRDLRPERTTVRVENNDK